MNHRRNRHWNRVLAALLALALAAPTANALAGADEDQIAREMADAAAKAAVKEMGYEAGKSLVDLGFQSAPPPSGEETVGSSVVAWARLGLAVNDYIQADTDKQRTFAAADAITAGVAIACPPAGAIVAVAVLAIKLIDMHFSKVHAKEMMKLAQKIMAHLEVIQKIQKSFVMADYVRMQRSQREMQEEFIAIQGLKRLINEQCAPIRADNIRLADLRACLALSSRIFPRMENFLDHAEAVINFESPHFDRADFYRRNKLDWEKEKKTIEAMRADTRRDRAAAEKNFEETSAAVARAVVQKAIAEGRLSPVAQLRNDCYAEMNAFNRSANLQLAAVTATPSRLEERRARLAGLYAGAQGLNRGCLELAVDQKDPLFRQAVVHEQTRRAVAEFLTSGGSGATQLEPVEVIQ